MNNQSYQAGWICLVQSSSFKVKVLCAKLRLFNTVLWMCLLLLQFQVQVASLLRWRDQKHFKYVNWDRVRVCVRACLRLCVPLLSLSLDLLVDVVDSGLKFLSSLFRRKMTAVCRTWALQHPHIIILYYTVTVMWFNACIWFHRQAGVTLTSLSDSCPIRGSMKEIWED